MGNEITSPRETWDDRVECLARRYCASDGLDPDEMIVSHIGHKPRWMLYRETADGIASLIDGHNGPHEDLPLEERGHDEKR